MNTRCLLQSTLKLNPTKTELIWLNRAHAIEKLPQQPRLHMNSNEVLSSSSVLDLGLIIDSGLTLATHVSIVARNCFYQLRRIRQAKKGLDEASVKTLVQALVLSRLDYCNSILANLPDVTLAPLVRVQHSAARLIRNLTKRDSVLPVMMELHWLPLRFRIVCADAWRPLRFGTKIPGRDGRSHLVPTRSRASSFSRFTEL